MSDPTKTPDELTEEQTNLGTFDAHLKGSTKREFRVTSESSKKKSERSEKS